MTLHMILYHPYAPSLRGSVRCRLTERWLQYWRPVSQATGWRIIDHPCLTPTDYEDGLLALWGRDHLVILEHDLVPTAAILDGLARPHAPVCAQFYRLHRTATEQAAMQTAARLLAQADPATPDEALVIQDVAAQCARWRQTPDPLAHRVKTGDTDRWVTPDDHWADYAGFGLIRFTRAFQRAHRPSWRSGTWRDLDTRVSEWLIGLDIPIHLHGPEIPHHHGCTCHAEASQPAPDFR